MSVEINKDIFQINSGRTLFISSNFPPVTGGSAIVYDRMCRLNAERIVALAPRLDYQTGKSLQGIEEYDRDCGFIIHRFRKLRPTNQQSRSVASVLRSRIDDIVTLVSTCIKVAALCQRYKIQVVCIGELIYGGWIGIFAKYILRRKFILYTHGEEISQEGNYAAARMRQTYLQHADLVIAVSLFCATKIFDIFNINRDKVKIIPNGVDISRFYPKEKDSALIKKHEVSGKYVIGTIGRLVKRKGVDMVISALPYIRDRIINIHYIVVGEGEIRDHLQALASEKGVSDIISFVGYVSSEQLPLYYSLLDLFVMPNRELADGDNEGFGLVFLEANACGVPVIGGRAGGAPEAVCDMVTGLLVDGTDPQAIASAVVRILSDQTLRLKLGQQGLVAAQAATWDSRAREFAETLQTLSLDPVDRRGRAGG